MCKLWSQNFQFLGQKIGRPNDNKTEMNVLKLSFGDVDKTLVKAVS